MTRTVFDAEVSALTVPEPINKWVNDKTHGKIQAIIDEVRDETKLLIVNAIYFKVRTNTDSISLEQIVTSSLGSLVHCVQAGQQPATPVLQRRT
jgi:serine protease inhibitor